MSRDFNLKVNRTRARYNPVQNPTPFVTVGGRLVSAATLPSVSAPVAADGLPERGVLRSGSRFAARNTSYFSTLRELYAVHKRLLDNEPAVSTRIARVGESRNGSLLLTTIRFRFDYPAIAYRLRLELLELFRQHSQNNREGFEVIVTFNAVLTNHDQTSFSVFYGQDFRAGNNSGAAPELKYGDTVVVKTISDISKIPTSFDADSLIASHRRAFETSNVKIFKFLNIVFLVVRFLDGSGAAAETSRGGQIRRPQPSHHRSTS
jgi:hypothetical protein